MKDINSIKYTCRVALAENIEAGFVWLSEPKVDSRTVVRINNCDENRIVYCQVLNIDNNFCKKYNIGKNITTINETGKYLVANKWYRDKLKIEKNKEVNLEVFTTKSKLKNKWWAYHAARKHPENSIRLSTSIATLSLALGLLGILIAIVPFFADGTKEQPKNITKNNNEVLKEIGGLKANVLQHNTALSEIQSNQKAISSSLSQLGTRMEEINNKIKVEATVPQVPQSEQGKKK